MITVKNRFEGNDKRADCCPRATEDHAKRNDLYYKSDRNNVKDQESQYLNNNADKKEHEKSSSRQEFTREIGFLRVR